ncbi:Pre-rRNA-processing protein crb3/ipi3 [Phialemonium atrogriseum]|uniref:Pre-rRNA-processing protein IPI3 n=1 Tax=Phialemonium atrogriseum TaxID=1093897 RepID=A0AAJ0BV02_9PEZI|nr:Pre-rRNA-processing protein crb3/ipi3 [Phialemonium atrogriseum]KAK1763594.1 Pre-rRNA-processing protein crb3/ipi3 [Phialemonium atrogriseum]
MLSEEFVSSICGPPLTSNTAIAKDAGINSHTLSPAYSVNSTFKKSATPVNCLAVNDTHAFAAQHEKAYVHVYSRLRGNQEAFVSFPERIRCLTLAGDVLIMGTAEGRLMLWEICTGRLVSTPPRHVQAVSCVAATSYHVITGSDDSDIHVWSLSQLLELDSTAEHEPDRSLPNHRAAITSLVVGQSANPDTSICVSASKDKSCIVWNYLTGDALRTLLFPSFPLCVNLDPSSRALFVSSEDSSLYMVEFFAERPLLGPGAEDSATVVQVSSAFGVMPSDAGPASCLAASYDGTLLLTGHPNGQILKWDVADNRTPVELANLNASVTNIIFTSPLPGRKNTKAMNIVKPGQGGRHYTFTAQLESELGPETRFDSSLNATGFPQDVLEGAISAFQQPSAESAGDQDLARQNDELWGIINEQRALQKQTLQKYIDAKAAHP